jgi:transcriptional regulator with XRE-family HTH domain
MNESAHKAGSVPMSNEIRGKALRERMLALGLDESKLARATGKDRGTLRRAFAGNASDITYEQLEVWFDREERKNNADDVVAILNGGSKPPAQAPAEEHHEQQHVMIRIEEGGTVVVDGPPENMEALADLASRLIREMRASREA